MGYGGINIGGSFRGITLKENNKMKTIKAHLKVYIAYLTNNWKGKRKDIFGRTYRSVYKKFGYKAMIKEYLEGNTWNV